MIRFAEYILVRALLAVLGAMPYATTLLLARLFARIAFRFDATPRIRAMENLRLAYGGSLDAAETERIARGVFETISRHVAEVSHITRNARGRMRFENPGILQDAYDAGRGVVLVSAHMGCFIHMVLIPRLLGVRAAVIMKKQQNGMLLDWGIRHLKRHFDLEVIQKKNARRRAVELLQQGGVVGFFADQHPRKGGFPARFFGREITAAGGPTVYAKRFNCPLVILTAIVESDGTHVIRFDGPISTEGSDSEVSQRWMDRLEARIRKYPEQWTWMHRRWRGPAAPGAEPSTREPVAVAESPQPSQR